MTKLLTVPNLTRWAKAVTKPRIGIGPSGTSSKRSLCRSIDMQGPLRIRSRVFSGFVSFQTLISRRKFRSKVQACHGGDGDDVRVIGRDFCEEVGLGVPNLLDARLG